MADTSRSPDLVHVFAAHAASVRLDDLPREAREAAKMSILDTLGVMLAASGMEPAVGAVLSIVNESGGRPDCSVVGSGQRAPAIMAALANGALAHCLDYDDQTPWGQHCASSIVPAVFAAAEYRGGVSGAELLTAVAVGQDLFGRLRRHVVWKKDWNLSTVLAVFAAAAAAARVLGLPARGIADAIGIASMQSSGVMEMVAGRGSDLRGMYAGFSAKGAVLSALMARNGVTGIDRMFEGPYGFFNTYFAGRYDRSEMLRDLGQNFFGSGTLYKRWPCVGTAHSHMKAAIDIVSENNLAVTDIAEIRLHVGDYHDLMCQPLEERRAPRTLADAKFSLPFLVSIAVVRKGLSVRDFTGAGLEDAEVLTTGRKVTLAPAPDLNWNDTLPLGRVEMVARDGRTWLQEGRRVPGNADNPMGWTDLAIKFRECASVSARPISQANIDQALELSQALERVKDGTEVIRLLA